MAVIDNWINRDGTRSKRYGVGSRWRVKVAGMPQRMYRTKTEALEANRQMTAISAGNRFVIARTTTVDVCLTKYEATLGHLSRGRRQAIQAAIARVRADWQWHSVAEIMPYDIQTWLNNLVVVDRRGRARPASQATRDEALRVMRKVFDIAITDGVLAANPCHKLSAGRYQRKEVKVLGLAELQTLAEAMPTLRDKALVMLLGTCGLRISEALGLQVGDVEVARRRLRVRKSKSGKARDVPISRSVLDLLDLGRPVFEPVFPTSKGTHMRPDTWRARVFNPAVAALGRPDLTPHALRHTAASLAISAGADVKVLQRMLGHASAQMTLDIYGHLYDHALDDLSVSMDAALRRASFKAV